MKSLRVSTKIWVTVLTLVGSLALLAAVALKGVYETHEQAVSSLTSTQMLVQKALVWKGVTDAAIARSMAAAVAKDDAVSTLFKESLEQSPGRIKALRTELAALATTDRDAAMFKRIAQQGAILLSASARLTQLRTGRDETAAAAFVHSDYVPATKAYLALIDELVELQQEKVQAAHGLAEGGRRQVAIWGSVALALLALAGMGSAYVIVRTIRRPLDEAVRPCEGHLTQGLDAGQACEPDG